MRLLVASTVDGFRRCGRRWSVVPAVVEVAEFSPDEWARLRADRNILVEGLDPASDPNELAELETLREEMADRVSATVRDLDEARGRISTLESELSAARSQLADLEPPTAAAAAARDPETRPPAAETAGGFVSQAIGRLDREDRSLWTRDGKPQTSALENLLGRRVTAAERNEAWEAFQTTDGE